MPLIDPSSYVPPRGLSNGHLQTIVAQFRKVKNVVYRRERIATPDYDFLDLDWSETVSDKLAILSHGLEGNTGRHYIQGMVRCLNRHEWSALAWNYRSCGSEPNRLLRSYHSGETGDLETVLEHAMSTRRYREIALIGFSLGGNVTLKFLGEQDRGSLISKAVAFSVPCDLASSADKLARASNLLYMKRFLRTLRQKVREKKLLFPDQLDVQSLSRIRTFREFDDAYTAPIHGFKDASEYFARSSSRQFLPHIKIPTLLVNAQNDPFLDRMSFPFEEAQQSKFFYFEAPESGGHTGFISFNPRGEYWSETRALAFLETPLSSE